MEDEIDWDDLFGDSFFDPSSLPPVSSPNGGVFSNNQPPLSVDDIEQLLMKDDDQIRNKGGTNSSQEMPDGFFQDILLDSPLGREKSGEVVDASDGDNSAEEHKTKADVHRKEEKENSDDDPLDKKRKRQVRNKDAALRSRERKKLYVRDLEMKSRYYEGECRRLGSLLQCFMAENQALRFSLHSSKAYSASMTKQESAVLFLESLLLGSLLWLMGTVCLLLLPRRSQQSLGATVGKEKQTSLFVRKEGSRRSLLAGKRFKASRSRMRLGFHAVSVLLAVF